MGEQDGTYLITFNMETAMDRANEDQERIVTIGGTFDMLHIGHKEYIRLAFEFGDRILIYVNSDEFVNGKKAHRVETYAHRVKALENFLKELQCQKPYQIRLLHKYDDLIYDYLDNLDLAKKIYMAIISPEYYLFFREINDRRKKLGIKSVLILVKERLCYSQNARIKDYSSSKIHKHIDTRYIRAETIIERNAFELL